MSVPAPPARASGPARVSNVSDALARDRLGVPAVVFFVMAAATPLTVVAGVVTTGFAVTGLLGLPLAFVVVGALLGLFSVGYVAMARRVANAGALYAFVTAGLGRPAGVGAAWVALLAYNALTCALYGAVGAAVTPLLSGWFGWDLPWWTVALACWTLVAALGVARVDLNGRILAVLLVAEVVIIVVFSVADLLHPAGGTVSFTTLDPGTLFGPGLGALLVLAMLAFVGFESAVVFSEESKNPRRTVPAATYLSVGLIAVLYTLASWAMTVTVGPENIVGVSREQQTGLVFNLATTHLGATMATVGTVLFATSVFAAMVAFHSTTARYMFALGRERVLPVPLGRTNRAEAPAVASLTQSAVTLAVVVMFAVAGWDPLVGLFYLFGTAGGLGVLLLITATSLAVVVFFARHASGENRWRTTLAPTLATLALAVVVWLAVANVAVLLGVADDSPLRWGVPALFLVAALLGVGWALVLRATRPTVYATIGLGAKAATGGTTTSSPRSGALDQHTTLEVHR